MKLANLADIYRLGKRLIEAWRIARGLPVGAEADLPPIRERIHRRNYLFMIRVRRLD